MTKKKKGTLKDMVKAPRTIDIEGQLHMLAWITPKEGKTLKAMGGAGTKGPMGIPMYLEPDAQSPGGSAYGGGGFDSGANEGGPEKSGGQSSPMGMDDERDPYEGTGKTAMETLGYDLSSQVPGQGGRPMGGITKQQYENLPFYMKSLYTEDEEGNITGEGISEIELDPKGRVTGFYHEGTPPGVLGMLAKSLGFTPTVYTGFGKGAAMNQPERQGGRDPLQTITAPVSVAPVEEEDTPLTQAMKDYYTMGVGTGTQPSAITDIIQETTSPIGSRYDKEKGLLYLQDGTVIDIKTGKKVDSKSRIKPLRISGLEMFKPIGA
jgi:hypothetical protein